MDQNFLMIYLLDRCDQLLASSCLVGGEIEVKHSIPICYRKYIADLPCLVKSNKISMVFYQSKVCNLSRFNTEYYIISFFCCNKSGVTE